MIFGVGADSAGKAKRSMIMAVTNRARRGFTLTEVAVVFTVITIVLGGIWWLAGMARENIKRQQALEEIITIVSNVRAAYSSTTGIPASGANTLTPQLALQGSIPSYIIRTPTTSNVSGCTNVYQGNNYLCPDGPWGSSFNGAAEGTGTIQVCDWQIGYPKCNPGVPPGPNAPLNSQFFAVVVKSMPYGSCISLVTKVSGASGPTNLKEVNINTTNVVGGGGTLPVSETTAAALCLPIGPNTSIAVSFIYNIRAPVN